MLFQTNTKVMAISERLSPAHMDDEISKHLSKALTYLSEDVFTFKTPLSQIYRRNKTDLNCKRHLQIFDTNDIIPVFCFGCFKVQVEVDTFSDLIRLTSLFYSLEFDDDLTRKTMIELRPNMSGFYKGLIYCRGLDSAEHVKIILDNSLKSKFKNKIVSKIKRGCSEFPLKFPEYERVYNEPEGIMDYRNEWKVIERNFDQINPIKPVDNVSSSIKGFSLSDFYIVEKWIDYAKGISDPSSEIFSNKAIAYPDIYKIAKLRRAKFDKVFHATKT